MNKVNLEVEEGEILGLLGPNDVGLRNVDSYEFENKLLAGVYLFVGPLDQLRLYVVSTAPSLAS